MTLFLGVFCSFDPCASNRNICHILGDFCNLPENFVAISVIRQLSSRKAWFVSGFGNQNASRNIPVPPPIIIEQQSSAPTKRYSRRPNVSTRIDDVSEQSGDVRVAGIGRQDYPVYQNSRQMNYNSYQGNSSHYPGNYGNQQYQHNHSMESQGYYAHPTHTGMEYFPPQQHVYYQQNENYY